MGISILCFFFFFNDTATTEIYPLSLHDALPISVSHQLPSPPASFHCGRPESAAAARFSDRKSTRLNSSHANISYAVFCLKKKKKKAVSIVVSNCTTDKLYHQPLTSFIAVTDVRF